MKILELSTLTPAIEQDLHNLISKCDGYEPFFEESSTKPVDQCSNSSTADTTDTSASCSSSSSTVYIASYDEMTHEMTGFLSWLITESATSTDKSTDPTTSMVTAEVTALVDPAFRRLGIFTELFTVAKQILLCLGVNQILCALPDSIANSSLNHGYIYKEALMQLNTKTLRSIAATNESTFNINPSDTFEYYYSDDELEYLMYEDDGEEPIAVLNLDYQESFTNIYGVYVDESLRGHGIGSLLMNHLILDYASICDLPLVLQVSSLNKAAVSLYKKCGFTEVSHISYYSLI